MDGFDALSDQNVTEGPNGNESAGPGVQPETGTEHLRNATSGCFHDGIAPTDLTLPKRALGIRRLLAAPSTIHGPLSSAFSHGLDPEPSSDLPDTRRSMAQKRTLLHLLYVIELP